MWLYLENIKCNDIILCVYSILSFYIFNNKNISLPGRLFSIDHLQVIIYKLYIISENSHICWIDATNNECFVFYPVFGLSIDRSYRGTFTEIYEAKKLMMFLIDPIISAVIQAN